MAGLPTITVELGSGTLPRTEGLYLYDITAYVDLSRGMTIQRGRQDEFSTVSASTLTLTLDNIDGRFTFGSSTYNASVNQMIRVTETVGGTVSRRFTGYVQDWPAVWPTGGDNFSQVTVTATDRLPRLARRTMRSILEQEILVDGPSQYWTLGESEGATQANDSSGNAAGPLVLGQTGTPVSFGTGIGPGTDGLPAAQFDSAGQVLAGRADIGNGAGTIECWVVIPTPPTTNFNLLTYLDPGSTNVTWQVPNSSGQVYFPNLGFGPNICDGSLHHLAVTWSSGGTMTAYVDAVSVGSITQVSPGYNFIVRLGVFTGTMAHVAFYANNTLSAARIASHYGAGVNAFAGERSDQRIARLLTYAGVTLTALEVGVQNVPAQDTSGSNLLDVLNTVADAEAGLFFIRGDGFAVMQNRSHRAQQVTPDLTLTTFDINPDATFSVDMQNVFNQVTAKGVPGNEQVIRNAASIAQHEIYPTSLDLLVSTDQEALDRANWTINTNAQPRPKLPDVTVDLLTQTTTIQQAALALELSDRISITGLPSQAPGGTSADLLVEGWTETLTKDSWSLSMNTSNFASFCQFILDNATLGVLDSTVPIGI